MLVLQSPAWAAPPSAGDIIQRVLEIDPWGLGSAEVAARIHLTNKNGATSLLSFQSQSWRYAPPLSKSLVRFSAPADLAGAGFLQVQKTSGDDDRFLFLPELKKARRIAGSLRSNAFMGTDFSFADLDRRDLRDGKVSVLGEVTLGKYPCYHLEVIPADPKSPYSRVELWVRQDNFLPIKWHMFDHSKTLLKTLTARAVKRIQGHWFITQSLMVNHRENHQTQLVLDTITPREKLPEEIFTLRNLEKI
jgi:hypothetical protein